MSVIALTCAGSDPSVVTDPQRFSLDGQAIRITDGDMAQLDESAPECNASYDLRVGATYREHREDTSRSLGTGDGIRLLPGQAVLIETEEWVEFRRTRFGQILPKVSLLQKGIANTPTKVDPGYHGRLVVTVFNHGKRTETLKRLQRFCSLYLLAVEGAIRPYNKGGKQIEGPAKTKRWQRLLDWLDTHRHLATLIYYVISLGSFILALFAYFKK